MKFRHLLALAVVSTAAATASAFEWTPAVTQPNPSVDVTQAYQLETLRFGTNDWNAGYKTTDVMPIWIDEDENEIVGSLSAETDASWDQFVYSFDIANFKMNGEYILKFPEGVLVNAAGEKSDEKVLYYTVEIPELATGMFSDFEVISISPDFSLPQGIWSDQQIKINTNHNEAIGFVTLQIYDPVAEEYLVNANNYSTDRGLGDPSEIVFEVANTYKFFDDREYRADFTFYNGSDDHNSDGIPTPIVAKESYKFTGKVEGYKYSDLTLLEITPAPGTLTISEPSQAVFTYTFSGPVNVYKAESPQGLFGVTVYDESCLSSNDDKTVWTLNLSDNDYVKTVDAELAISIYVRDLDGSQLKGDFGEDTESCFTAAWQCDLGAKSIVVVSPENGATLDQLTEVVVKSESGETMTWTWVGEAYIANPVREEIIGTLVYEQPEGEEAAATEFRFTKMMDNEGNIIPIDIVKEGIYAINFSPGCFVFGEEFSAVNSRSLYSSFSITGNADDTPDNPGIDPAEQETLELAEANPAVGSTVESLETITLTFPEAIGLNGGDVTVYNADNEVVATGYCDLDRDNLNVVIVKLNEAITAEGNYEVVIPARAIVSENYEEGVAGICTPELRLYYTVKNDGSGVASVDGASKCDVYDIQGRRILHNASAADLKTLSKGIYVVGGKKLVVK